MALAERPPLLGRTRVLADLRPERRARAEPTRVAAGLLVLPAGVLLALVVGWPVLRAAGASVTDGAGFAGVAHFREVLGRPGVAAGVARTALTALVVPAVVAAGGLVLALGPAGRWGRRAAGALALVAAAPLVTVAVAFRSLYGPEPPGSPGLVGPALLVALGWAWVGAAGAVFRAAVDRIEPELADAVLTHGGGRRQVLVDALWRPVLRRTFVVVLAVAAVASTRVADLVLVTAPPSERGDASVLASRRWPDGADGFGGPTAALLVVWLVALLAGAAVAARWARRRWPPPLLLVPEPDAVVGRGPAGPLGPPGSALRRGGRRAALGAGVAVGVLPLVALVGASARSPGDRWWEGSFTPDAYRAAFDGTGLAPSLLATGALAVVVAGVVTVVGLAAAATLAWVPALPRRAAGAVLLAAAVVPVPLVAGSVGDGSWARLVLVHVATMLPWAVLLLRNALADVDLEQLDHARRTGRPLRAVAAELAPGAVGAAGAVAALAFVLVWGDVAVARLAAGDGTVRPVALVVLELGRAGDLAAAAAAGLVVAVVPVLLVALARRSLATGLTTGALR